MPQEVPIDINPISNPNPSQTASFNPPTMTVMVNDLVFWRNNDTQATHQPKPAGGADDAWVKVPISKKLGTQVDTSNTLSFGPGTTKQGVPYVCALHANEKGTLIVRNNININNVPGAETGDPQASFNPGTQTVQVNELFIWSNNDVNQHWPAPSLQQQNAWMSQAIQPGKTSQNISFGQATDEDGLTYICALHPDETGIIVVQQSE
jgi:plastocyanin